MDYLEALEQYERMIYKIVGRYRITGFDYEDLANIGRYVLWVCCRTYDESKGWKFSTYLGKALNNECYKMYKYSQRAKRCKDDDKKSFDDYCNGDLTYAEVLPAKPEENLEPYKKDLLQLTNRLPKEDKELIYDFMYHKMYINEDYTIKEFCKDKKVSYVKVRRIIDDMKYVISLEWGL